MHTKRLPNTPRKAMVDHKLIWNTVAPRGWWRYTGKPGTVAFAEDMLAVLLMCTSCMIVLVSYLQEKQHFEQMETTKSICLHQKQRKTFTSHFFVSDFILPCCDKKHFR